MNQLQSMNNYKITEDILTIFNQCVAKCNGMFNEVRFLAPEHAETAE
jgi:hypothetical protein